MSSKNKFYCNREKIPFLCQIYVSKYLKSLCKQEKHQKIFPSLQTVSKLFLWKEEQLFICELY